MVYNDTKPVTDLVSQTDFPNISPAKAWLDVIMARRIGVLTAVYGSYHTHDTAIFEADEMWNGLRTGGSHEGPAAKWARAHYFYGGRSAMRTIGDALVAADAPCPSRILDFPCGHGRVLRFLRAAFPQATIYGGDINLSGVDFCANQFAAEPVISQPDLRAVELPQSLDLVWCGSLATHLDEPKCLTLFERLVDALAPGGVAGITVCSRGMEWAQRESFKTIPDEQYALIEAQRNETGFGYADYPWSPGYGMAFIDLRWIRKVLDARSDAYLLSYAEKAWHGTQDVVWIIKRPLSHWYNWLKD